MIERKREYVRECIRLLYTYICVCVREGKRERKNGNSLFSEIMGVIYDVEELIRIGFSWPTAISHRRIKKENIVNKRKSKKDFAEFD